MKPNQARRVKPTSLQAYQAIKPELQNRHEVVWQRLKDRQPSTANEIAQDLYDDYRIPQRSVTPRFASLERGGSIVNAGTRKDFITGKVAVVWKTVGKKAVWKAKPKLTDNDKIMEVVKEYAQDWAFNPKTGRLEAYFKFDEKGRVVR
jgi:hypothetical protein